MEPDSLLDTELLKYCSFPEFWKKLGILLKNTECLCAFVCRQFLILANKVFPYFSNKFHEFTTDVEIT